MLPTLLVVVALVCVRFSLLAANAHREIRNPRLDALVRLTEMCVIATTLIFLIVRPFIAQTYFIPSTSMYPTLRENDRILVNKVAYRGKALARNDVVVFQAPREAGADDFGDDFVKRVVALEGDVVEVHSGRLIVNGRVISEPFVNEPPEYELAPYVVPAGKVFVMGDNRNHSNDSHRWGAVDRERIIGRAICIYWPPAHLQRIR
jgi:signal peptidase I